MGILKKLRINGEDYDLYATAEGLPVVQNAGYSDVSVMSQKAVTDTLAEVFEMEESSPNLLNPENMETGVYLVEGGSVQKQDNGYAMRTISPIQIPSGTTNIYLHTNADIADGGDPYVIIHCFNESNQYVRLFSVPLVDPTHITLDSPDWYNYSHFHVSITGTQYGVKPENVCLSFEDVGFKSYGTVVTLTGLKPEFLPSANQSVHQSMGEDEASPMSQKATTEAISAVSGRINSFGMQAFTSDGRKNLFNKNAVTRRAWWNNGVYETLNENPYLENYSHSDYIPVTGGGKYVFSAGLGGDFDGAYINFYTFSYFDAEKEFISQGTFSDRCVSYVFDVPENAAYVIIVFSSYAAFETQRFQFEEGETPTEYEEYIVDAETESGYYLPALRITPEQIENFALPETEYNILQLPEKYELVVGDTFELFYKGVMLCKDPYCYNIRVQCSIGKAWGRKFEVTPTAAGNYTLTITISDDTGKVLDEGSTVLSVSNKMTSPSETLNVLCIGDSLTVNGVWVDEAYRRLTKTNNRTQYNDEAPAGDGLAKINFIGKRTTANGAGYEGNGGWRFSHYNDTSNSVNAYWLTTTHNKTDSDQESIYTDAAGVRWQLETIELGRLKFKKYAGEGALANTGTLTWVSGGVNHDAIEYSEVSPEEGNPFVYNGAVNFGAYCNDIGASGIDHCFILLGWNDAETPADQYKAEVKAFVDKLIAFNENIKITLIGLQIPSLDGCANNYGASGIYANYRGLQEFVFSLDRLYADIASEYPNNVDTVNLSGQFDTEYNCIIGVGIAVNTRNPEKVTMQYNGVHPSTYGYYQIADAVYRKFTADN